MNQNTILNSLSEELKICIGNNLKKIILYGSQARGEATEGSDYDILVVVDHISKELLDNIDEIAGEYLFRYDKVFSILPVQQDRYVKNTFEPFLKNVFYEGIAL